MSQYTSSSSTTKRKCFISYTHLDEDEVSDWVEKWAEKNGVFIPKILGVSDDDSDVINSDNPTYVMSKIRDQYLLDSTVTIVLIGNCTHSRRYVDWELKSTLRRGKNYTPNGLLGIILPSKGKTAYWPPRLVENVDDSKLYGRCKVSPSSSDQLRGWIEDAFGARTTRDHLIQNDADMFKYNHKCEVHGVTH